MRLRMKQKQNKHHFFFDLWHGVVWCLLFVPFGFCFCGVLIRFSFNALFLCHFWLSCGKSLSLMLQLEHPKNKQRLKSNTLGACGSLRQRNPSDHSKSFALVFPLLPHCFSGTLSMELSPISNPTSHIIHFHPNNQYQQLRETIGFHSPKTVGIPTKTCFNGCQAPKTMCLKVLRYPQTRFLMEKHMKKRKQVP